MIDSLQGIGMTSARTRQRMIDRLQQQGITHGAVLNAMNTVPRHIFLDEALAHRAYEDTALPIGSRQTLSQPFIVAWMSQLLLSADVPVKRILEVGTGSGYCASVLSHLVDQVYTIERIANLLDKANGQFRRLKITNIKSHHTDGYQGWPTYAPYDGIMVTAACSHLPNALIEQLKPGARLIIPLGSSGEQTMTILTRTEQGYQQQQSQAVRFVPLLEGLTD